MVKRILPVKWKVADWGQLSKTELYQILRLRSEVFVVEQNCAYQDLDEKDKQAFHLMGFDAKNNLVAYARILHPNVSYPEPSIGRVVTSSKVRRNGIGKLLMQETMKFITKQFGNTPVRISAQSYLLKFYSEFGFKKVGKEYLEDNIPHHEMLYSAN